MDEGDGCCGFSNNRDTCVRHVLSLASANALYLNSVRDIINRNYLKTTSNVGWTCQRQDGLFLLGYYDKDAINTTGEWFRQPDCLKSGRYPQQKCDRLKLFQELFMGEKRQEPKDRVTMLNAYLAKEKLVAHVTLDQLTAMSRNEVQCPKHFRFEPFWVNWQDSV